MNLDKKRCASASAIISAGLLACSVTWAAAPAIPGHEPSQDPRDLTGVWRNERLPENRPFQIASGVNLTETAAAAAKARVALRDKLDATSIATPHLTCRPEGLNVNLNPLAPTYILQSDGEIVFIVTDEGRDVRHVYMNVDHPKNIAPSYGGHSVGHWEGDVLVVDTVGYNGRNGMGEPNKGNDFYLEGVTNSEQLHVTQRFTKSTDGKTIMIETTFNDPKVMTGPTTTKRKWSWVSGRQPLEYNCEQNPRRDNIGGMLYDAEYLRPVCIQEEGKGADLSRVICDRRRKWPSPVLPMVAP